MPLALPTGVDDFRKLRETRLEYVDKSQLICELIDKLGIEVAFLARPPGFGKSLNLSMVRCYWEKRDEDLSPLFQGLRVWDAGDEYRAQLQRYPLIYLSFEGISSDTYEACDEAIRNKVRALFEEHRYLLESDRLSQWDLRDYRAVLDGTARPASYVRALLDLSSHIHRVHGQRVIILIDDCDEPIRAAHIHGYGAKLLDYYDSFLGEGLKGNQHLQRGVLTGTHWFTPGTIFSGFNNVVVYSLLRSEFKTCYGFTQQEVEGLLDKAGRRDALPAVRDWYGGYLFGDVEVYNPSSVLAFLASPGAEPKRFFPPASSNDLAQYVLDQRADHIQEEIQTLLDGGSIEVVLEDYITLSRLAYSDAVWSVLTLSGYLRAERRSRGPMEQDAHRLSIPNQEVRELFASRLKKKTTTPRRTRPASGTTPPKR